MKSWLKIWLFCTVSLVFIGCDRATKELAKEHLKGKGAVTYLQDTFRLQYVENTGAAMGLGDALSKRASFWLLSILPLVFLTGIFGYAVKYAPGMGLMKLLSLALIFSGGMGNIIDRLLFDRHVTDFMNMGILSVRTGIFNVADVCVTSGAIGLLFFFQEKKGQTVAQEPETISSNN
jgi:signal peptidase II